MKTDATKIVEAFAHAMAAANMFSPADMRDAAQTIRTPAFSAEESDIERSAILAYAQMLERRATEREHVFRATYGKL